MSKEALMRNSFGIPARKKYIYVLYIPTLLVSRQTRRSFKPWRFTFMLSPPVCSSTLLQAADQQWPAFQADVNLNHKPHGPAKSIRGATTR
jgi:hypothetical protein